MDENWYTNESVWSLSFFYPDPQEDLKKKKKKKKEDNTHCCTMKDMTLGGKKNGYEVKTSTHGGKQKQQHVI